MTKKELKEKEKLLFDYKEEIKQFDIDTFIYNKDIGILADKIKMLEDEINSELRSGIYEKDED